LVVVLVVVGAAGNMKDDDEGDHVVARRLGTYGFVPYNEAPAARREDDDGDGGENLLLLFFRRNRKRGGKRGDSKDGDGDELEPLGRPLEPPVVVVC
jgi:hypothetical protein